MKKHKLAPPCINQVGKGEVNELTRVKMNINTNQSAKYRRINGVFVGSVFSTTCEESEIRCKQKEWKALALDVIKQTGCHKTILIGYK